MINLSPFRLFDVLKNESDFGLFENLQSLDGQTKCDYSIVNASVLKKMIKNEANVPENESNVEEFVHGIFPIDFRMMLVQTLQKHDLI
jgi:hypothetical protein